MPNDDEDQYDISGTLDKIAAAGVELTSDVKKVTGVNVGSTLDSVYDAILERVRLQKGIFRSGVRQSGRCPFCSK